MKHLFGVLLSFVALLSCTSTGTEAPPSPAVAPPDTIRKIAGYDVGHLGLLADEFDLPYQKITGRFVLYLAAEACDTTLFMQVLRKEENPAFELDGDHILVEIAFCDHPEAIFMTQALLAEGVDINAGDADEDSFLSYAVGQDDLELVRFILANGGDLQQRDVNPNVGCPPIHNTESIAMLKLLMEAGADATDQCDNGRTLLHYTAKDNLPELAQYLLENRIVDPAVKDKNGETALDYATKYRAPEVAELLKGR